MTRDVYISVVGKVIEVVETRRTNILGRDENPQEPQEMEVFEENAEEEKPTKQWLEKEGESERKWEFDNCRCQTDSKYIVY